MSSIIRARSGLMGWWEASEVIRGASLELKVAGPSMLGIRRPDRHALPLATSPTRRQRFTHPPPAGAGSFDAHFGLTPRKYQSGETDITGRISKIGDGAVRTALYEAANVILTRPVKGSTLKSWGMRLAGRAGMRKAKVALARKLAVVLHRMLADGTSFLADKAAAAVTR